MITFNQAKKIILDAVNQHHLATQTLLVTKIKGSVCAQELLAPLAIQPFDNSAMDGFAVKRVDLSHATPNDPITLKKTATIGAGEKTLSAPLTSGTCQQIMTGAPIPQGADAVVPIEQVRIQDQQVQFSQQPKAKAHIRFTGEDFKQGDPLLKVGDPLSIAHILPLSTLGINEISVFKKPRVALLATGNELVDDLQVPLQFGQIYNANRPYAQAFLESLGCEIAYSKTGQDHLEEFTKTLAVIMDKNIDFVISSGAVSAGEFDFVKAGLESIGAKILYHKIHLKPGKPNLLARLPNGTLYFGLPGNPVAAAVGLRFLVTPAVQSLQKQPIEQPLTAQASNSFTKNPGRYGILKGIYKNHQDGTLQVTICEDQASFMVNPFLTMNCWVHIEAEAQSINPGDCVKIYPFMPLT